MVGLQQKEIRRRREIYGERWEMVGEDGREKKQRKKIKVMQVEKRVRP